MAAPTDPEKRSPAGSGETGRAKSQSINTNNHTEIQNQPQDADILIGVVRKNSRERFELRLRDFGDGCQRLALVLARKSQSDDQFRAACRPTVFAPELVAALQELLARAIDVCVERGLLDGERP
jgi:hypothetical protein